MAILFIRLLSLHEKSVYNNDTISTAFYSSTAASGQDCVGPLKSQYNHEYGK